MGIGDRPLQCGGQGRPDGHRSQAQHGHGVDGRLGRRRPGLQVRPLRARVPEARTMMRIGLRAATLVLVTAGTLSSCAARATLVVVPSSPQLRAELSKLAASYAKSSGMKIEMAGEGALRGGSGGSKLLIDWSLGPSAGDDKSLALPDEKLRAAGFNTALAFELVEKRTGAWAEVPILWDTWGIVSSPEMLSR